MKGYLILIVVCLFGVTTLSAHHVEVKRPQKVELTLPQAVLYVAPEKVNVAATAPTVKVERIAAINEYPTTTTKYMVYAARQSLPPKPRICTPSKASNIILSKQRGESLSYTNKATKRITRKWVWCR